MKRITEEQKVQINEFYYVNHNKSLTARTLGISLASVTRYLIDGYVPIALRKEQNYSIEAKGVYVYLDDITENVEENFLNLCKMTEEEKEDLEKLKETLYE